MNGFRDEYGVWNVEDKPKPVNHEFRDAVELKVAVSFGVNGWRHGPVFICEQAQEEAVDQPAWLRGLDQFPMPPGAAELRAEIGEDAEALFEKIEKLKGMY